MGRNNLFIKDSAINKKENDEFSYVDYVENLRRMIEENTPPFNIAIIGKWGVGKSSIINLLKRELEGKNEYVIQDINAWKYEHTSIKRAFMKHLYKNLNGNRDDLVEKIRLLLKPSIDVKSKEETLGNFIKKSLIRISIFLLYFIVISAILFFLLMAFDIINLRVSNPDLNNLWGEYTNSDNIVNFYKTIDCFKEKLYIPLALLGIGEIAKLIIVYKSKQIVRYEINPAIEGTDEYEELFINTLKKYKEKNINFKKLIVVVDDLDRLSIEKIVDALDAIKAFVEVKECIFIVPFDDSILRKAINSKKIDEGDLYLDKLFQFKLILPPLIDMDMQEYAFKLCKKEIPEIFNLCTGFETILREVLIYPYVNTPRQIVKIINTFVGNLIIVKNRENKKIEADLITNVSGLNMLAKISVLQAEFPEFYQCLLQDNNSIEKLLKLYHEKKEDNDINYAIEFGIHSKERLNSLIGFLIKTEHIYSENLSPYIYLGQDELGLNAGDERQRSIRKELLSGNDKAIKLYSKDSILSEIDTKIIIQVINESKLEDLKYTLKSAIQVINYISEEFITEFSTLISNKLKLITEMDIEFRYWQVDIENYLKVYGKTSNIIGIQNALSKVIGLVFEKNHEWKQKNGSDFSEELFDVQIENTLDKCLDINEILSREIKNKLKKLINDSDYSLERLLCIYNKHKNLIVEYFCDNFYNKLCKYIKNSEDIEDINGVINVISEIAVVLRRGDKEKFVEPLIDIINTEENIKKVCELIQPVAKEISSSNSDRLVSELLLFDYSQDTYSDVIKILIDLNWNIDTDKNEKINEFIINGCDYKYIDEIKALLDKIQPEDYNLINKSIEYIFDKCLENPLYDEVYENLIIEIDTEIIQKQVGKIKKIVNSITNSDITDKFIRCIDVIKILLRNKKSHEILSEMIGDFISNYRNNSYLNSYPTFLTLYTELIGTIKDILDDGIINKYVDALINYTIAYKPNITIKGLYYIGKYTPEIYSKSCIEKVISNAISVDDKKQVLKYLKDVEQYINKKNNNLNIYCEFLTNYIEIDTDTALNRLDTFFRSITEKNLYNIVKYLMKEKMYDKKTAFKIVNKFLDELDRKEFIKSILKSELCDIMELKVLSEIIDYNIEGIYKDIIDKLVLEITEDDTITYLNNLLNLSSFYKDTIDKKLVANIVNYIWLNFDDKDIIKMAHILKEQFGSFKFKNAKGILSENIVSVFQRVNIETKKEILDIAKMFDFNKTFRDANRVKDFSDSEKGLLKEVLKIA